MKIIKKNIPHSLKRLTAVTGLALVLLLASVQAAKAVEMSNDGYIGPDEVVNDDLFISAENVTIEGTINGNLFISGSNANVKGVINGDLIVNCASSEVSADVNGNLLIVGQHILLDGPVSGSVFGASASFEAGPAAHIERNLYFAGFDFTTRPGSVIERDALFTGYQAHLSGEVKRDVNASLNSLLISGKVGRDVHADVEKPDDATFVLQGTGKEMAAISSGIQVDETAEIGGVLYYTSSVNQDAAIYSSPAGGIQFTQKEESTIRRLTFGQVAMRGLKEFITLVVFGGLAIWLIPQALQRAAGQVQRPLPAAGWGAVTICMGTILAIALVLTAILAGVLLAIVQLGDLSGSIFFIVLPGIGLAFGIFITLLVHGSKIVIANWAGKWIFKRFLPAYQGNAFWPLLAGIVLFTLLHALPVIRPLLTLVSAVLGMGAIWLVLRSRQAQNPTPPAPDIQTLE